MLDVGHSQVPYWCFGEGPDLFFVHGWPLTSATWRELVPSLSEHFTCHLIDLPGTGESEWDADSEISMRAHAKTVAACIDQVGIDRYSFVGQDSGGAICRMVAAVHADRVEGIVMGNTEIPGHVPPMLTAALPLLKLPGSVAALRLGLQWRPLRDSKAFLGGCFDDMSLADGSFGELFIDPLIRTPRALKGQLRLAGTLSAADFDGLYRVHPKIKAPVLLIWGVDDPWFPLEHARPMLEQFPAGAELVELPGKLLIHEERPEAFVEHCVRFLAPSAKAAACSA